MITTPSIIRPYPTGACAPSAAVLGAACPLVLDQKLNTGQLNSLALRDLVESHRYGNWPVRIQGQRQTCVAFAAAACIELLRAGDGQKFEPLSPQFLYWHMRQLGPGSTLTSYGNPPPGWDKGATKLGHAKEVLINIGICAWSACPYMDRLAPDDPDPEGPRPTDSAVKAAAENRIAELGTFYFDRSEPHKDEPSPARMVYDLLADKRPVAITIPVFYSTADPLETNWDNPVTTNSGEVIDPVEGDWMRQDPADATHAPPGHAVCIVGFQPDAVEPTGGWFIFRNSRGINWAAHTDTDSKEPPIIPERGYGAISATYVERCCWEVFSPAML